MNHRPLNAYVIGALLPLAPLVLLIAACGNRDAHGVGTQALAGSVQMTETSAPTLTPTCTSTPDAATPASFPLTPTATAPPSPTPATACGNCLVEADEACDDGAVCVGGDLDLLSQTCGADGDCGVGGDCRPVGGDGCAANCTAETAVESGFRNECTNLDRLGDPCDPREPDQCGRECCTPYEQQSCQQPCPCDGGTSANFQLTIAPVGFALLGSQVLRIGEPRALPVAGPSQRRLFDPGDIPVVIRASESGFDPIIVPPLACVCLRTIPLAEFGPGNAASGKISCGEMGLRDVDYRSVADHHIGTVPDELSIEECEATVIDGVAGGAVEMAGGECRGDRCECTGPIERCGGLTWKAGDPCTTSAQCNDPHPGLCTFVPERPTFSGSGGRGAGLLVVNASLTAISDGGICQPGDCGIFDYGPDCTPCTDDDLDQRQPLQVVLTTGRAGAEVRNANAGEGVPVSISAGSRHPCRSDQECPQRERCTDDRNGKARCSSAAESCSCRTACGAWPCLADIDGQPFSCEALAENPFSGVATGQLVGALSALHEAVGFDTVITLRFVREPGVAP